MYSCQTNIVVPHLDLSGDYNVLMPNQYTVLVPHLDLSGDYNVLMPNQYSGSSLGLVGRLQCTHAKPIYWFLTWTCRETTMYSCQTNILVPHLDLSGDYNVLMPNQSSGSSLGLVGRLQCTHAKPIYWFLTWTCQETTMYSCQTNIVVPHLDLSGDYNVLMPNQYSGPSLGLVRRLQCTHAKPI